MPTSHRPNRRRLQEQHPSRGHRSLDTSGTDRELSRKTANWPDPGSHGRSRTNGVQRVKTRVWEAY